MKRRKAEKGDSYVQGRLCGNLEKGFLFCLAWLLGDQ